MKRASKQSSTPSSADGKVLPVQRHLANHGNDAHQTIGNRPRICCASAVMMIHYPQGGQANWDRIFLARKSRVRQGQIRGRMHQSPLMCHKHRHPAVPPEGRLSASYQTVRISILCHARFRARSPCRSLVHVQHVWLACRCGEPPITKMAC
jgi:hypothetical protein